MNHTPGPWEVTGALLKFEGQSRGEIAYTIKGKDFCASTANANLIAAAPDLLEALELLYHWGEGLLRSGTVKGASTYPLAEAAIAIKRARGGE